MKQEMDMSAPEIGDAGFSSPSPSDPKIYVFSNVQGGGDGVCLAMAEDGTVLGSHWCSSEHWAPHDLGVIEGSRPDRHEHYRAHYPDGYEMVFVPAAQVARHPGITEAYRLNQLQREASTRGAEKKGATNSGADEANGAAA